MEAMAEMGWRRRLKAVAQGDSIPNGLIERIRSSTIEQSAPASLRNINSREKTRRMSGLLRKIRHS
ncbi:hypothetical protein C2134_12500 [Chromobacterium sinusclupearum]|uniref:Uncharacterized protein n=1 Tax=Chromobacterium sinusclupearum TaxID=2077146 RepID=A0A2K4MNC7_9NEIS|nr:MULTISPECIES: hypothetical protein [Chromobacterium]POA98265.1 hypothetical protein C2134_12500 [Chromobacterium sinusclupearum]